MRLIVFVHNTSYPRNHATHLQNSTNLSNLVKIIPLNRLLVETDSPYLSPVPFRGKDNEPSYIKYTVDKISSIKNVDVNLIKNGTSKNFLNLFVS